MNITKQSLLIGVDNFTNNKQPKISLRILNSPRVFSNLNQMNETHSPICC
jgi:predicted acetyltransferase